MTAFEANNQFVSLQQIQSVKVRNLLRGVNANSDRKAKRTSINRARRALSTKDAEQFAIALMASGYEDLIYNEPFQAVEEAAFSNSQNSPAISIEVESIIQATRAVANSNKLVAFSELISRLNDAILRREIGSAAKIVQNVLDDYGRSRLLDRKILYLFVKAEDPVWEVESDEARKIVRPLFDVIGGSQNKVLQEFFVDSLVDVLDHHSHLVNAIQRLSELMSEFSNEGTVEKSIEALIKRIAYPTLASTLTNATGFYRYGSANLMDAYVELLSLKKAGALHPAAERILSSAELSKAEAALAINDSQIRYFLQGPHSDPADQAIYRLAGAMGEIEQLSVFRSNIDNLIHQRDAWFENVEPSATPLFPSSLKMKHLAKSPSGKLEQIRTYDNSKAGTFLRTIAVLSRIEAGETIGSLEPLQIRVLLGETAGFASFLTEEEMLEIERRGDAIESPIIKFLVLVMMNQKNPDEDREFEIRATFQEMLIEQFQADIMEFLEWLATRTPTLANLMVEIFDISFLERLYFINESYNAVLKVRQEICRWAADKLGQKYLVQIAERLAVDAKIKAIRDDIDDTRVFVDEIRYRQWAMEELPQNLRRFQLHLRLEGDHPEPITAQKNDRSKLSSGSAYWIKKTSSKAFREFCHNRIFGIESYLSRRIRHGTLKGTLISPIKKMILEFKRKNQSAEPKHIKQLDRIYHQYIALVEAFNADRLQYASATKPKGLLSSELIQPSERAQVQADFEQRMIEFTQAGFGAAELAPIFIDHCWIMMETDLVRVRSEVRNLLGTEIRPLLRSVEDIQKKNPKWKKLATELDLKADSLFNEVSRWFTRPETSSLTVSIEELVTVVRAEACEYNSNCSIKSRIQGLNEATVSGLTYHTAYDVLYVIFDNIAKYADLNEEVIVNVDFERDPSGETLLVVEVVSALKTSDSEEEVSRRIRRSLSAENVEKAMFTEGGSGFGKASGVIEGYPGNSQFGWSVSDRLCSIEIKLPIVLIGQS